MNELKQKWEEFIRLNISDEKLIDDYLLYISKFIEQGLPIIFNLKHFALLVGIDVTTIVGMINQPGSFYREFEIPKRSGNFRKISAPYPSLLYIQRWIYNNILSQVNMHVASHGFISNKSIISNAQVHLNKKCLLKIDIKDFFPSIKINRVISIFSRFGYPHNLAYCLSSLCCLDKSLPQGSATSPIISNIISKRMDNRLYKLSEKYKVNYTRYADDLAFSGEYISLKFYSIVENIIKDEGFIVNQKKTKLIRGKYKKIVTGISVSGEKMKLPKSTRRILRQEAFHVITKGFINHTNRINNYDPLYIERLIGRYNFWHQIEPENEFVINTLKQLYEIKFKL